MLANHATRLKSQRIRVGTWVKLKHPPKTRNGLMTVAQVIGEFSDIEGGVILSEYLDGFRCWNKQDLVAIKRPMARRTS